MTGVTSDKRSLVLFELCGGLNGGAVLALGQSRNLAEGGRGFSGS